MGPSVKVGDKLPDGKLYYFDNEDKKQELSVHTWAAGKRVILFGVPGAFTPTCSLKHLPGFIEKAKELHANNVASIGCLSVNDPFVMKEWGKGFPKNDGQVLLLADGAAEYTRSLGFEIDLSGFGLGIRSRRFSLMADDLVVKILHLEEGGDFSSSGAEDMLKELASG